MLIVGFIYFVSEGQKRFLGDIFLGIMFTLLFSMITPLLFNKLMNVKGQEASFILIIIFIAIPLLLFSFFNHKGRFYPIKLDCNQESQIEKLENKIINKHGLPGLFERDSIDHKELKKLKKIKPLNQERKEQKQAIINKANKLNIKIEKQHQNKIQ